jgi:hypothetical protein
VVDAHDDRDVFVLRGGRDDDLLGAAIHVLGRICPLGEEPRGLDDDVHAEVAPREVAGVPLGQEFDVLAVDREAAVGDLDLAVEAPEDRVVFQQVSHRLGVTEVVHRHDLEV